MISRLLSPWAVRLATYERVRGSVRIRVRATVCRAELACRSAAAVEQERRRVDCEGGDRAVEFGALRGEMLPSTCTDRSDSLLDAPLDLGCKWTFVEFCSQVLRACEQQGVELVRRLSSGLRRCSPSCA